MMLVSLSLLGVVAARIRSQHQLVIGQKHSSKVAVSAEGKLDATLKLYTGDIGRFKKKDSESWLHCPDILKSDENPEAYCRFSPNPKAANVWKMRRGGVIDGVQQYQFVDQTPTERCLMRQSCHSSSSALSLADPTRYWSGDRNCNHCGTKHWQYTASSFKLAEHTNRNCVQSDGRIRHCEDSYQKLVFVKGRYEAPRPKKTFECISRAQAIADRESAKTSEHEDAILLFETQMFRLEKEAKDQQDKSDKLGIASAILNVGSGILGAIPVVGGAVSFLTKAAGVATSCAAAAADARAEEARYKSIHKHMDKISHQIGLSTVEITSLIRKVSNENREDKVALQIAAISQHFLDMKVAAAEISASRWLPEDLLDYPAQIKQAFGQIRLTFEVARQVSQFISSMRECVLESDGQLVEKKVNIGKVEANKLKLGSAVNRLQRQVDALRTLKALCTQNRESEKLQEQIRRDLAIQQEARERARKADEARREATRLERERQDQHEQDTYGFGDADPGVDCSRYTYVDECKDIKGGQEECERKPGYCSNRAGFMGFGEKTERYRCRWSEKSGCRSTKGTNKNQKCRPNTCKKPSEA